MCLCKITKCEKYIIYSSFYVPLQTSSSTTIICFGRGKMRPRGPLRGLTGLYLVWHFLGPRLPLGQPSLGQGKPNGDGLSFLFTCLLVIFTTEIFKCAIMSSLSFGLEWRLFSLPRVQFGLFRRSLLDVWL